jgi:hypothetical protein
MIYKFKSKSAGDVIMMGPTGDHVLRILGREPAAKGIIESADMPAAMQRLEQAVKDEEAARAQAEAEAAERGEKLKPAEGGVTLRQRAWPLIDMMKRSHAHGHDIVWGV